MLVASITRDITRLSRDDLALPVNDSLFLGSFNRSFIHVILVRSFKSSKSIYASYKANAHVT